MPNNFDILSLYSPHCSERGGAPIDLIVLHCVGVPLVEVFKVFDEYKVSSHYVVPQITGAELQALMPELFGGYILGFPDKVPVIQLVSTEQAARHAGISTFSNFNTYPGCEEKLNACSIGIEFHAPGYANGDGSDWYKFAPYTEQQKEVGMQLISYLVEEYNIPPTHLLAHSTIAVKRKTDPGPLFFWEDLHSNGLGYLPTPVESSINLNDNPEAAIAFIQEKLIERGFSNCLQTGILDEQTQNHIDAYIMQFASHLWEGCHTPVTQEFLDSLNGFAALIQSEGLVDPDISSLG